MTKKRTMVGDMISTSFGTMVGISLIGPTASMANALPAGTAKTVTQLVPGFQSLAVLGPNIKLAKKSTKGIW